jgi:uncharacterized membrane protein
VGDIVGRTWDLFFHRFLHVCIVVIVTGLLTLVALTVGLSWVALACWLMLQFATLEAAILVAVVGLFPALLPAAWIYVGQLVYLLKLARGHKVRWYDTLRGGPYVVHFLHAAVLIGLLALVGPVLGLVPSILVGTFFPSTGYVNGTLAVIGLFFGVFPAMVVRAVFAPAWYLMVERELKPVAALKASCRLIRGNFVPVMLVLALNMVVDMVAHFIPCGIGQLLATPFIAVLWTVTYLRLTGQPTVTFEYEPAAERVAAGD